MFARYMRDEVRLHPGRDHHNRNAKAGEIKSCFNVARFENWGDGVWLSYLEGWNMIVESTTFVVAEDEYG